MRKKKHKVWSDLEKYQLYLAYEMGTQHKILSLYFRRSESAINSFLNKSGIRHPRKRLRKNIKIRCLEYLREIFIKCGIDRDSANLERDFSGSWQPSPFTIEKLTEYNLILPPPWQPSQQKKNKSKASIIHPHTKHHLSDLVSMEVIIAYLKRRGYKISRIPERNPYDHTYAIDGKPYSDFMCLMFANEERLNEDKPVFHVKGITAE